MWISDIWMKDVIPFVEEEIGNILMFRQNTAYWMHIRPYFQFPKVAIVLPIAECIAIAFLSFTKEPHLQTL